ncbi:hypothetical protein L3i22_078230 [Actinoplanes sp. L3-i22]|nr:hypothetical protein L3i22_078230 [Actinoplanes sp. L3-i22]
MFDRPGAEVFGGGAVCTNVLVGPGVAEVAGAGAGLVAEPPNAAHPVSAQAEARTAVSRRARRGVGCMGGSSGTAVRVEHVGFAKSPSVPEAAG